MDVKSVETKNRIPTSARIIDQRRLRSSMAKIHGVTRDGCIIESQNVFDLSDRIGLQFDTFDRLVGARILWRKDRVAGVEFEWGSQAQADNRQEHRVNVSIPVVISDLRGSWQANAVIKDSSKSGCQIESVDTEVFPRDILIKLEDINAPIKGKVVWYGDESVGVKLDWNFATEAPEGVLREAPE